MTAKNGLGGGVEFGGGAGPFDGGAGSFGGVPGARFVVVIWVLEHG
ncbi:MAG TPA: hypothetical protein VGD60_06025 [Candidatus Acidoferrales bacterium]